jgi:hypothetical protein
MVIVFFGFSEIEKSRRLSASSAVKILKFRGKVYGLGYRAKSCPVLVSRMQISLSGWVAADCKKRASRVSA